MISLEDDMAQSMERALIFGAFLDSLSRPTPEQEAVAKFAAELERQRDPDEARKHRRDRVIAMVMQRDGSDCWFCGRRLGRDITIEHLQPLALGGKWGDDNLGLAHRGCNKAAGHLSRIKKEHLREQMRASADGRRMAETTQIGSVRSTTSAAAKPDAQTESPTEGAGSGN